MNLIRTRRSAMFTLVFLACVPVASAASEKEECSKAYVTAQTQKLSHELLSARATLLVCTHTCAPFMHGQMVQDCADWLVDVNARIPTVIFSANTPSGKAVLQAQAFVDGAGPKPLFGEPTEVDPGQHVFTFTNGRETVEKTATVLEGIKGQLVAGVLADSIDTAQEQALTQSTSDNSHFTKASNPTTWLSARTAVPFSVGAAGLLTGAIFGLLALHDKANLDESCPAKRCTGTSQSDVDALHTHSWIANIGFGVLVGVVSGVVLWRAGAGASTTADDRVPRGATVRLLPDLAGGAQLIGNF